MSDKFISVNTDALMNKLKETKDKITDMAMDKKMK